jgi:hypothetical protein
MHARMGGPHDFRVTLKTNDPVKPEQELIVRSNWSPDAPKGRPGCGGEDLEYWKSREPGGRGGRAPIVAVVPQKSWLAEKTACRKLHESRVL